jgi:hypothetical protein
MKAEDRYHKWVEWSEEDRCYVGRCPDLFFGGCHGSNPLRVFEQLNDLVREEIRDLRKARRTLPKPAVRPMLAVGV